MNRWQHYVLETFTQAKIWLFAVLYLGLFRICLILFYHNKIGSDAGFADFLGAVLHGFRFDSAVAGQFLIIPFFANAIFTPFKFYKMVIYIRQFFAYLFVVISTLLFIATIAYFKEYNDQFNYFMFEALYDDRGAIFETIWVDYHPIVNAIALLFLIAVCSYLLHIWLKSHYTGITRYLGNIENLWMRGGVVVLIVILFAGAARGSFKSRPAMRKWADITTDSFLNKTIINPYRSIYYAVKDYKDVTSIKHGLNVYLKENSSIVEAAERYFGNGDLRDLHSYLKKTSQGPMIEMPDHIFLVVMESYDSWPLQDKYQSLGVANQVKNLAHKGVYFKNFLPSGRLTLNSVGAITTGVPYVGVNISRIGDTGRAPFISSLPETFKRLGYTVKFYYSGFLSWQNIGNFMKGQGVEEVYAAPHAKTQLKLGVWGVDDEDLFNLVLKNTKAGEKTFNIILTTSYHGPFTIDVVGKGFPLKAIPKNIEPYYDGSIDINILGHLWYSDKAVGDFVAEAERRLPGSLFALTGDHYGRRFLNGTPSLYERSSVPFILYGSGLSAAESKDTSGSHIDIMPTLVELVAPADFVYYSFGQSLFADKAVGFGRNTAITKQFIAEFNPQIQAGSLPNTSFPKEIDSLELLKAKHDDLHALGWWLTMKGNLFKGTD